MRGLGKENKRSMTQDNSHVPASRRSKKESIGERTSMIVSLHVVGAGLKKAERKSVRKGESLVGSGSKNNNLNMEGGGSEKKRKSDNPADNDLKVEGKRESKSKALAQAHVGRVVMGGDNTMRAGSRGKRGIKSKVLAQTHVDRGILITSALKDSRLFTKIGTAKFVCLRGSEDNVIRQLDREVKQLTFPGSAEDVERLIKNQQQSYFANAQPQQQQQRENEGRRGKRGPISSILSGLY
ncbi:unnamed protein product [Lupinus luteus]|uniref:Uncharacterized protein n=1 Tax=Lupinus luteus TaxID=3873 RepID=A0AAV1W1J7_LUPLU